MLFIFVDILLYNKITKLQQYFFLMWSPKNMIDLRIQ